jgi:hypothetical protein
MEAGEISDCTALCLAFAEAANNVKALSKLFSRLAGSRDAHK